MKRLLAAAALAAALSCSAAGTQDIQKHGEEYFRIFSILPDGQGILARRCTKLTQSGLCVGAPVLLPADAVKAPAEEKVVRLADPKEAGWHTLQGHPQVGCMHKHAARFSCRSPHPNTKTPRNMRSSFRASMQKQTVCRTTSRPLPSNL